MTRRTLVRAMGYPGRWWLPTLAILLALVLAVPPLHAAEDDGGEPPAETATEETTNGEPSNGEESEAIETAMAAPAGEAEEPASRSAEASEPAEADPAEAVVEEAPEAAPEPEPEPEPLTFRPPLSLNECLQLIDQIMANIPEENSGSGALPHVPTPSILRMIDSCYGYLNIRDDLHTSLAHYQWMRIGETRVADPGEERDRDVLHFDTPVRNISALSLHVDRGDVLLHGMWVYDEEGMERQQFYFNPPKRLRHSLPRMEVFHLWTRTQISRIEIEYTRAEEMNRSPKVFISGGVTNRREYIKTALYNLKKEAEPAILQGRYAEARRHLDSARENIVEFSRLNRGID